MNDKIATAFRLLDTFGLPLSWTITLARQRGLGVDLPQFYLDAVKAGWKHAKIRATILDAVRDVDGPTVATALEPHLEPFMFVSRAG